MTKGKHPTTVRGFTLIELSIALVIIGLLVGGVLVGRDLIEAAKLRAVISQYEEFKTAVNTFRLKYNALPGDIANPTQFGFSNPSQNPATGITKGNGLIEANNGAMEYSRGVPGMETTHFWYHLSKSGLIKETLLQPPSNQLAPTGIPKTSAVIAQYIPQAKIGGPDAFWYVYLDNGIQYYAIVGTPEVEYGYGYVTEVFTPVQVRIIDQKIDDGLPTTGQIRPLRKNPGGYYLINVLANHLACRATITAYATNNDPNCNIRFDFQ